MWVQIAWFAAGYLTAKVVPAILNEMSADSEEETVRKYSVLDQRKQDKDFMDKLYDSLSDKVAIKQDALRKKIETALGHCCGGTDPDCCS